MPYNLTEIANVTDYVDFVQNVNSSLMNNYFGIEIIVVVGVIAFLGLVSFNQNPKGAFIASSFLSFLISVFFVLIGLVPELTVFVTLILLALSIAMGFASR